MIGVLVFDDFQLLDATGPIAAFEIAYRLQRKRAPITMLALKAGAVRSSSGVELNARSFRRAQPDTLIIAGGEGMRTAAACKATLAFVRSVARRGSRVASVCSGTYVLAEAGLLEGKRATTHWRQTRDFIAALSEGAARGRPHLCAGRQHLELGRHHRRHRSRAGDDRRRVRRGDRAGDRAPARRSITAAPAGSRSSRRCSN